MQTRSADPRPFLLLVAAGLLAVACGDDAPGADPDTIVLDAVADVSDLGSEPGDVPEPDVPALPDVSDVPEPDTPTVPDVPDVPAPDAPIVPDVSDVPEPDAPIVPDAVDAPEVMIDAPDVIVATDPGPPPPPVCGDGSVDPGEACDDGNEADGDWCSSDCQSLTDASSYASFASHPSYRMLTTSNGLAAAMYAVRDLDYQPQNKLTAFRDHLYSHYDEATASVDLLWDLYFGYRLDGVSSADSWLNNVEPEVAEYLPGTNIVRTVQVAGTLTFESFYFAPFHHPALTINDGHLLVALVHLTNTAASAAGDASVFSLINVHMGGEGDNANELVTHHATHGYLSESRGARRFLYQNLVPAGASYTADSGGAANNPWMLVQQSSHYSDYTPAGALDDVAVGFENAMPTLAAGEERWFGVVVAYTDSQSEAEQWSAVDAFIADRTPETILQAEIDWWEAWHADEAMPAGLTAQEQAVYRQSTAVFKMCQVRETSATGCPSDKCHGQVLASLVPGQWNISWVRDASYAIAGMVASNHLDEARDGLAFMLQADLQKDGADNYYQKVFIESSDPSPGTWGLGVDLSDDYAISVTRYFGRGLEESDANAAGPNIEWDNWGLFLWAFADYVIVSGDTTFATTWWPVVSARVGDLLVELVEPETGLLYPDSSIWERHWCPWGSCAEPETRKHFTYSSVMAAWGLERASAIAAIVGDVDREATYAAAAAALGEAIREQLVYQPAGSSEPMLAGNLEEAAAGLGAVDLAVVEAINAELIHPASPAAFGTFAAFDANLAMGPHSPGYRRNDDPTWYDNQEWVVVDLRGVSALARMGQQNKARTLLDWVTGQATENLNLIGELYSDGIYQPGSEDDRWLPGQDDGGDYQGAIPMCGFGPGAYILALWDVNG